MVVSSPKRAYSLDAMRGLAAILVAAYHLSEVAGPSAAGAYRAVDFFFALSGYVLAKAYESSLRENRGVGRFMLKRVIRLYPMFLLGLGFGLLKALGQVILHDDNAMTPFQLVLSLATELLFLPSPATGGDLYPLNGPGWSLFFELLINFAFALWLVRLRNVGLFIVAALGALAVALSAIYWTNLNVGWSWPTFAGGLARVTFSFSAGILICRAGRPSRQAGLYFLIPIVLLIVVLIAPVPADMLPWVDTLVALVVSPALLWFGAQLSPPRSWRKVCEVLGDISYPVYAVHFPLVFIAGFTAGKLDIPAVVWAPVTLVALLALGLALGRLADPSMRRTMTEFFQRRPNEAHLHTTRPSAVVLICNKRYILPTLATALSARRHISDVNVNIFIFVVDADATWLTPIMNFTEPEGVSVAGVPVEEFRQLCGGYSDQDLPSVTLARFFVHDLLPKEVDRFLYLDGDMFVAGPLDELLRTRPPAEGAMVVADYLQMFGGEQSRATEGDEAYFAALSVSRQNYFNAGLIYSSCVAWQTTSRRALEFLESNLSACRSFEQSALNYALRNSAVFLPQDYNYQSAHMMVHDPRDEGRAAVVYHFTGVPKPWDTPSWPWDESFNRYFHQAEATLAPLAATLEFPRPPALQRCEGLAHRARFKFRQTFVDPARRSIRRGKLRSLMAATSSPNYPEARQHGRETL